MRRAIIAFAVVAGLGLMTIGCGGPDEPTKGGDKGKAPATDKAPAKPADKAPVEKGA